MKSPGNQSKRPHTSHRHHGRQMSSMIMTEGPNTINNSNQRFRPASAETSPSHDLESSTPSVAESQHQSSSALSPRPASTATDELKDRFNKLDQIIARRPVFYTPIRSHIMHQQSFIRARILTASLEKIRQSGNSRALDEINRRNDQLMSVISRFQSPPASPILPVPITAQDPPLQFSWTLYYDRRGMKHPKSGYGKHDQHKGGHGDQYEESLVELGKIQTVRSFWSLYNNLKAPSVSMVNSNYHFFKENIKPLWEDPANARGGKWTVNFGSTLDNIDDTWLNILLALIGETLDPADFISGVVFSRRARGNRIAIWLKSGVDAKITYDIGNRLMSILKESAGPSDNEIQMEFQLHSDSMKTGASYMQECTSLDLTSLETAFQKASQRTVNVKFCDDGHNSSIGFRFAAPPSPQTPMHPFMSYGGNNAVPNMQMQQIQGLPAAGDLYGFNPTSQLSHVFLQQQQQQPPVSGGLKAQGGFEEEKIFALVQEVLNPINREAALLELSKRRETFEDLAPVLWHSFGVMSVLLQEIVSIYPMLSPPTLTTPQSNRVCNALALLQCVASHPETRGPFLSAHIPLFLYPFLNTVSRVRSFEYLRLTSLGVIGALVKNDNSEVISFLLQTEIIPLCLRIMESGTEISKTVAIFIVQKILLDDLGLSYICQTYERFYAVGTVLNNMVVHLVESQSIRILKHVVRCYLRLSDNPRAREALCQCLPEPLRDNTFAHLLKDDTITKRCLTQLLMNLSETAPHQQPIHN